MSPGRISSDTFSFFCYTIPRFSLATFAFDRHLHAVPTTTETIGCTSLQLWGDGKAVLDNFPKTHHVDSKSGCPRYPQTCWLRGNCTRNNLERDGILRNPQSGFVWIYSIVAMLTSIFFHDVLNSDGEINYCLEPACYILFFNVYLVFTLFRFLFLSLPVLLSPILPKLAIDTPNYTMPLGYIAPETRNHTSISSVSYS